MHSDLQWPNLPQAKQLPFLDGKEEERVNGSRSFWLRQEANVEKPRGFCGPCCKAEVRPAEIERLTAFLEAADFKAFSALSSALRIFLPSVSLSASSCYVYSSTVFQPNSDLSANKISFCLSESNDVPSQSEALTFSTAFTSRCDLASSNVS